MRIIELKNQVSSITRFSIISIVFLNIFLIGYPVRAQVSAETPYDANEITRKSSFIIPPRGRENLPVPGPRPSGPPIPTLRPAPVAAPAPTPAPAPSSISAPPSVIRGSGSNIGSVTLLFDPLSARVKQGTTFTQDIVVNNPRGTGYDFAEVMIKFNPEYLSVNSIESKIIPVKYPAAKIIINEVDNKKGIIRFGIESKTVNLYYSGAIATINWYAKKKTFGTKVSYIFVSDLSKGSTAIIVQNRDILGASSDPTDGVVSATISVQ